MGPFLRSLAEYDLSRIRPVSGLRRTAVTLLVMWAAWQLAGPEVATSTGMAALLLGFLDRQQSPRVTVRVMIAGTFAVAATQFVATMLSPWLVLVVILLVTIAFAEGASVALHPDAPIVLHFCGTIAATAAVAGPHPGDAGRAAAAVLIAGAAQTAATAASARLVPHVREVLQVADEVELVARALRALAGETDLSAPTGITDSELDRAARSMTSTERVLARSDLSPYLAALLGQILHAAEQVRLEAKSIASAHPTVELPNPLAIDHEAVRRELDATADTLMLAVNTLRATRRDRDGMAEALLATPSSAWFSSPELLPALADLVSGVVQVGLEQPERVPPAANPPGTQLARVRAAVSPGSLSFRLGGRIAVGALAAMGAAAAIGLTHASWASNAVLSIFRPDGGATLPRIALRGFAVSAAAVVVVLTAYATHDNRAWLLAIMGVSMLLGYSLGPANYGIFGFFINIAVLMVLAATGADPTEIAVARWADTMVGCSVAVLIAFLIPVWKVSSLPTIVASTCSAIGDYLAEIGHSLSEPAATRDLAATRASGVRVRDLGSDASATLNVARFEPAGVVPVPMLRAVLTEIRTAGRISLATENLLVHGTPPDPAAAELAAQTSATLARFADELPELAASRSDLPAGRHRREPDAHPESGSGVGPAATPQTLGALIGAPGSPAVGGWEAQLQAEGGSTSQAGEAAIGPAEALMRSAAWHVAQARARAAGR